MGGSGFPVWINAGSYGGLVCSLLAGACLAAYALRRHRGTPRQFAIAMLICVTAAALMLPAVWWNQARFDPFGPSLSSGEIVIALIWTALWGWYVPLGTLLGYMTFAAPQVRGLGEARSKARGQRTLAHALLDEARREPVHTDEAPWGALVPLRIEDGQRPLLLRNRATMLGRELDNDIVLPDERISRHHAEVRWDRRRIQFTDFGSLNGSLLNSQLVQGRARLQENDVLELGSQRYKFVLLGRSASASIIETNKMPGVSGVAPKPAYALVLVPADPTKTLPRWELTKPLLTIGRDPACDLCIVDASVSRRQAQIVRQQDGYYITDLESSNGTHVNGNPLTAPHVLALGDVVRFGSIEFRVATVGGPHSSITAPPASGGGRSVEGPSRAQPTIPLSRDDIAAAQQEAQEQGEPATGTGGH